MRPSSEPRRGRSSSSQAERGSSCVVGIVIVVLYLVLSGGNGGLGALEQPRRTSRCRTARPPRCGQDCQTGADANERQDCRMSADVNSIQAYWAERRQGYTPAKTRLLHGLGADGPRRGQLAGRAVLLPGRQAGVHRSRLLRRAAVRSAPRRPVRRGVRPRARYGHHVQDLLGTLKRASRAAGRKSSVRTELQADCYAGVWANTPSRPG